jgi:hypothetical protein
VNRGAGGVFLGKGLYTEIFNYNKLIFALEQALSGRMAWKMGFFRANAAS